MITRRRVKRCLSFCHENKQHRRYGRMRPVQNDALYSTIKVEHGHKGFVSYASYPAIKVPQDATI